MLEVLSTEQIKKADQMAIEDGIAGITLMENAGRAAFEIINERFEPCPVVVLCGPGNNGGDGLVIASLLKQNGWDVLVALSCNSSELKGDAKTVFERYDGDVVAFSKNILDGRFLVIDAIFGVGLSRSVQAEILEMIEAVNNSRLDVVSIDIPSGINSDTGKPMDVAVNAVLTITFVRKKLGHMLMPGLESCGETVVVEDIGIDKEIIESLDAKVWENRPDLWLRHFPMPGMGSHKYDRGHVIVNGGDIGSTGAAKLAAMAALRAGAGLVTVTCPETALAVYGTSFMSVMTKKVVDVEDLSEFLDDKHKKAVVIGPGNGVTDRTRRFVFEALNQKKSCVLDADAMTVFQDSPHELFAAIRSPVVMTPHEGEFQRMFGFDGSKIQRASKAARIVNAVILLKGADTVIAAPDGRVVISSNAPAWLATAGSGDVLSGIIAGLMSNNMDAFTAACAGVYLHSEAAWLADIGMISEDLLQCVPQVLQNIYNYYPSK